MQISAIQAQQKIAAARKKEADDLREKVKALKAELRDIAVGTQSSNPFVGIIDSGSKALERIRSLTTAGSALRRELEQLSRTEIDSQRAEQRLSNRLGASNLRSEAQEFRQGFRSEDDPAYDRNARYRAGAVTFGRNQEEYERNYQQNYDRFLEEERRGGFQKNLDRQLGSLGRAYDDQSLRARDKAVIGLTQGLDPRMLTDDQRSMAAKARENEAGRLTKQEDAAMNFYKKMSGLIDDTKGLKVNVAGESALVTIKNEAPGNASVETRPGQSQVAQAY